MGIANTSMLHAAIHEAGHAVVSNALGCVVKSIEIHFSAERNRWEGSYGHTLSPPGSPIDEFALLQKSAKIAVAGVFAQGKHLMEQKTGRRLRFSDHNDVSAWIVLFTNQKRSDATPGAIRLKMKSEDGECIEDEIDGSFYSGRDMLGFNQCFNQIQGLPYESLIFEVLSILDDVTRWNCVERLARTLVDCVPDADERRRLSESDIANELAM